MRTFLFIFCFLSMSVKAENIIITTWNIETLGATQERGFAPGFARDTLTLGTEDQLQDIAELIIHTLQSDVLAVQEIFSSALTLATVIKQATMPIQIENVYASLFVYDGLISSLCLPLFPTPCLFFNNV